MSSLLVGTLRVAMGLDSAQFEKGRKRVQRSAGGLEKSLVSMTKRLAAAFGAVTSVTTIRATQNMIDSQAKLAQSLGSTVEAMQNMARAGDLAGVSMSGIEQATKDLQRRLSQAAAGGGPASDALDRLGLSASNLLSLDLDDRVSLINKSIQQFVPVAQRAAVAGQLFGEEGSIAMSRIDPKTIEQATKDIRDFGVAVSEVDADQIERTNDAISRTALAWTGIKNQLSVSLAPLFETIANAVSSMAIALNKARNQLAEMTAVTERMIPYAIALGVALKGGVVVGLVKTAFSATVAIGKNIALAASILNARSAAVRMEMALGAKSVAMARASLVTKHFSRALRVMRGAMITTGIGALIVGAGELINFMSKLIKGAGGVGNAFTILGDIGKEAFDRAAQSVQVMKLRLFASVDIMKQRIEHFAGYLKNQTLIAVAKAAASFYDMAGSFAMVMSDMMEPVKEFINPLIGSFVGTFKAVRAVWGKLPQVFINVGKRAVNGLIGTLENALRGIVGVFNNLPGIDIPAPSFDSWKFENIEELGGLTEDLGQIARESLGTDYVGALGEIGAQGVETAAQLRETASALQKINNAAPPDFTSQYTAQADAISEILSRPWESVDALRAALQAASDDFEGMGDTAEVAGGVATDALDDVSQAAGGAKGRLEEVPEAVEEAAKRVTGLVDSLTKSFADFVVGGFRDFKGMLKSMLDSFKSTIAEMIATAAKNKIVMSLGLDAKTGLSGIIGKVFPSASKMLSGFGSGLGSVFSGLASGGLGGAASALGSALSGITSGLGGLGTALGALAGPIGIAATAISFFKKKTELLDLGLQVTVDGMDTLVQQFKTIKTTRFFGLSKKVSTSLEDAAAEVANPIQELVSTMQSGIADAANRLGVGASVFDDFAASIKLSTKGLSDDEIAERLSEEINKLGDSFAAMIPGLEDFTASGEGAQATLTRLTNSLDAVNNMSAYMGNALREMSVMGAGYAAQLADAFGGVEGYMQAHNSYIQNFFSQSEQLQMLAGDLSRSFEGLGIIMPETKAQFRAMVEAQQEAIDQALADGNADEIAAAQERYADILNLGPKFTEWRSGIENAFSSINDGVNRLLGLTENGAAMQMDAARDIIRRAAETGNIGANFDAAVQAATSISADQFGSLAEFNRARMETAALLNQIQYAQSGQLVQDYALVSQPILPPAIADGTGYDTDTLTDELAGRGVASSLSELLSSQEIQTANSGETARILRDILDVLEEQSA